MIKTGGRLFHIVRLFVSLHERLAEIGSWFLFNWLLPALWDSRQPQYVFTANYARNSAASRVFIAIEGTPFDNCAAGIRAMLKRTPGVIAAEVSHKENQAVDYDSQKTTPEKIVEAINNLGYKASVKNKLEARPQCAPATRNKMPASRGRRLRPIATDY